MGIDLKSIKLENVKAVALCFTPDEILSRAKISAKTGLSIVTVGKIADILLENGTLTEEKNVSHKAGRRAGLLKLNSDKTVVIAEISECRANVTLFDLNLKMLETYESTARSREECDSVVGDLFAEAAMALLNNYGPDSCSGVVIITDDIDDRAHFTDMACSFFPDCVVYADSAVNFSAIYASYGMKENEVLLYGYLSGNEVRGAFVLNHKLFLRSDGRSSDFGKVIFPGDVMFIDLLRKAETKDEKLELISQCLCNTARVVLPDHVIIEVSDDMYCDDMLERITKNAVRMLGFAPRCSLALMKESSGIRSYYHGAMLKIAEKWLEKLVLGENGD